MTTTAINRRAMLALAAATPLGLAAPARAHDPALHGFNMVVFKKPIDAPDFTLPRLGAADEAFSAYRGRWVLLNFWATWCPPCVKEMPSMQAIHERYADRDFTIVAVSSDEGGAADVQPFVDRLGVEFPVLLDADGKVSDTYGATNLPVSFVVDPRGKVVAAAMGEREWNSQEAISTLDEMLVPVE